MMKWLEFLSKQWNIWTVLHSPGTIINSIIFGTVIIDMFQKWLIGLNKTTVHVKLVNSDFSFKMVSIG